MDMPAIGSGATMHIGSDSYGCTVISVESCVVTVQHDKITAGEGHDYYSRQVWMHSPNPAGWRQVFRWDGRAWRPVKKNAKTGRWNVTNEGYWVVFGERSSHMDPSF